MKKLEFTMAAILLLICGSVAHGATLESQFMIDGRVSVSAFLAENGDKTVLKYDVAPVVRWIELPNIWAASEIGLTFGDDSSELLVESIFGSVIFDVYKYQYASPLVKDLKLGLGLFGGYNLVDEQAKIGLAASGYFF